jgi:hypothetical protein
MLILTSWTIGYGLVGSVGAERRCHTPAATLAPNRSVVAAPRMTGPWNSRVWTFHLRYGASMDYNWMRQKLEAFLAVCEQYQAVSRPEYDRTTMKPIGDKIDDQVPTVERIIGQLDPNLLTERFGTAWHMGGLSETIKATRRALAVVRDRDEWKVNLAPDSPSLTADEFHPTVWKAAAEVWSTGEYKMAAQAACISLSAHIKDKAGSPPLNDGQLVAQVFSTDEPKPGQSRLHFPGNHADDNWKSRQRGLQHLAQGAFAGIRNIAAHDNETWTEHEALEHLAVLSVVARWADETDFVSV